MDRITALGELASALDRMERATEALDEIYGRAATAEDTDDVMQAQLFLDDAQDYFDEGQFLWIKYRLEELFQHFAHKED